MNVVVYPAHGTALITTQYKTAKRLKVKVQCNEKVIYHDITDQLMIPLTFGGGIYSFMLYEQTTGNKYKQKASCKRRVPMDANAYTLSMNSYVNFSQHSQFYALACELNNINNIYDYFINNFSYDYIEAILSAKQAFTVLDLDTVFTKKQGTCYSLSALFTAMLRICKIPAKLVIGTADLNPHAWVEVNDTIYDLANALSHNNARINYRAERFY